MGPSRARPEASRGVPGAAATLPARRRAPRAAAGGRRGGSAPRGRREGPADRLAEEELPRAERRRDARVQELEVRRWTARELANDRRPPLPHVVRAPPRE